MYQLLQGRWIGVCCSGAPRDVRDGWTVTGQPRAAAQAIVEDACQLMEAFFFAGQHGRIGGAA
jgi:hypothetical protein